MDPKHKLSPRQRQMIEQLLSTICPSFAMTISNQLHQQLQTQGLKNPTAFVRYSVQAVRQGRFGPNRGLAIPRAKSATTGTDRQHVGEDQTRG